ncbi:hypothetical protein [Gimesia sp.]|uniref:hypothetical protein n=1 Tax=Gimesia sp. TaxID=2024833 RepID=UPI003A90ACFA
MITEYRIRASFHAEIRQRWDTWFSQIPFEQRSRAFHRGLNNKLRAEWSGADCNEKAKYELSVHQWIEAGPTHEDLYGDKAEQFRMFCEYIGVDYETLMSEPPTNRREVFKLRLEGKLTQYKKKTGRSMKALSEYLGWSEIDYQWLRRIKCKGADHTRTKKELLEQLAHELDTTLNYLFGVNDTKELPTWENIIELGINEFVKQQPEGSEFSDEKRVRNHLVYYR